MQQQHQAMHPMQYQPPTQQQQHPMHPMQQAAMHPPSLHQVQQWPTQQGVQPGIPPQLAAALVSTEHIQAYLDENKQLILAILEHQNSGKSPEVAQLQNRLQQNLIYLAAIADAQPQLQALQLAQMQQGSTHSPGQGGEGHFMQHPATSAASQHQFPPKVPMQFNSPQQMQDHQHHQHIQQQMLHQQQQFSQTPFSMRPGSSNGVRAGVALGGSGASQQLSSGPMLVGLSAGNLMDSLQAAADSQGNKQEAGASVSDNPSTGNGARSSTAGHGVVDPKQ